MSATDWGPDDPRWDDDRLTRSFGPRPPRTGPAGHNRRSGFGPLPTGLVVLVLVLVLVGTATVLDRLDRDSRTGGSEVTRRAPACDRTAPAGPAPVTLIGVIGERPCESTLSFDPSTGTLTLPDARTFQVGRPGDTVLLGDWDCDGVDTVGLYRPDSGEVFRFGSWARDTPVRSTSPRPTGIRDGEAHVVSDGDCDRIEVDANDTHPRSEAAPPTARGRDGPYTDPP